MPLLICVGSRDIKRVLIKRRYRLLSSGSGSIPGNGQLSGSIHMLTNDAILGQHPNLMVTGASGNLGSWICRLAATSWTVTGIHWQHPYPMGNVQSVKADLTDFSTIDKLFDTLKPSAVIHAAAVSQPGQCESDQQGTHRMNVEVPARMAAICADRRIPFVFTSTDLVFDGLDAPYEEHHATTPVCVYGRQKADAEEAILRCCDHALVCRMPLMIGVGPPTSNNFFMQMLSHIRHARPLSLLTDEFRTPVSYQDAANGVLGLLADETARGCLHLGGRNRVSRYEMGLLMAQQMRVAPSMLKPVTIASLDLGVARSPDCSLNSDRAYRLGYRPAPFLEAVQSCVSQFDDISTG